MSSKTKALTKEEALADRGWHLVDATGLPLGRLATQVAHLLRGKHKPTFTPNVDCGDHVVVINAEKVILTGNKLQQKKYFRHSGYIGGIKGTSASTMLEENPERMVTMAIKGMVKRGALGHQIIKKLKVYKGGEHPHGAQFAGAEKSEAA